MRIPPESIWGTLAVTAWPTVMFDVTGNLYALILDTATTLSVVQTLVDVQASLDYLSYLQNVGESFVHCALHLVVPVILFRVVNLSLHQFALWRVRRSLFYPQVSVIVCTWSQLISHITPHSSPIDPTQADFFPTTIFLDDEDTYTFRASFGMTEESLGTLDMNFLKLFLSSNEFINVTTSRAVDYDNQLVTYTVGTCLVEGACWNCGNTPYPRLLKGQFARSWYRVHAGASGY